MNRHDILELVDSPKIIGGRPEYYPFPREINQAFFIQRNHNQNAVVYSFNINPDGLINLDIPLNIYWLKYSSESTSKEPVIEKLNHIQRSLAYGYEHSIISSDLIKFKFVCHDMPFFISKNEGDYTVSGCFNEINYKINNIYVHADDFGAFPVVLFANFHVASITTGIQSIETISFG